jgi:hypothetical protein
VPWVEAVPLPVVLPQSDAGAPGFGREWRRKYRTDCVDLTPERSTALRLVGQRSRGVGMAPESPGGWRQGTWDSWSGHC